MKKILIILALCLALTGCSAVRIDTTDPDVIVDVVLSKNNKLYNHVSRGFKYYIPRGVTYIDNNELTEKLYSNGNYYYLFVDVISYFYKSEIEFKKTTDPYFSKEIEIDDKKGYLEVIKQENSKYLVNFTFNYSNITALVEKEDINEVILNATYILSTIKYNKDVIALTLDENMFTNQDEVYTRFESINKNAYTITTKEEESSNE